MAINYRLNQALLSACIHDPIDYFYVEELLKSGAKPTGAIDEGNSYYTTVYSAIFSHAMHVENFKSLPKITELFLDYGMDVNKPEIPYDNDDVIHPLWLFAFNYGTPVLESLRILLDHHLDAATAEICWGKAIDDLYVFSENLEEKFALETLYDTIRKIMLCASYPHVLDNSKSLRDTIWLTENCYDLSLFRQWERYDFLLDCSRCPRKYPEAYKTMVTIIEKENRKPVWQFGFALKPEEV